MSIYELRLEPKEKRAAPGEEERFVAKSKFLTAGELRRRGWTGALIRQFAGPADHLAVNPHHRGGPAMPLYQITRIEEIECGEQFIQAHALADRR